MNTPDFLEYVRSFQARYAYSDNDMAVILGFEYAKDYSRWAAGKSSYDAVSRVLYQLASVGLKVVTDPKFVPSLPPPGQQPT